MAWEGSSPGLPDLLFLWNSPKWDTESVGCAVLFLPDIPFLKWGCSLASESPKNFLYVVCRYFHLQFLQQYWGICRQVLFIVLHFLKRKKKSPFQALKSFSLHTKSWPNGHLYKPESQAHLKQETVPGCWWWLSGGHWRLQRSQCSHGKPEIQISMSNLLSSKCWSLTKEN